MTTTTTDPRVPGVDPRASLAIWLRAARASKRLSIDDVARITKIQPRILDKLETADWNHLPAEVFVRGFVRSFARCVGLDEHQAIERLHGCLTLPPTERPLVDPLPIIELAPELVVDKPKAEPEVAVVVASGGEAVCAELPPVVETPIVDAPPKKRRSRRKVDGTPSVIAAEASESSAKVASKPRRKKKQTDAPVEPASAEPSGASVSVAVISTVGTEPEVVVWQPTMPTIPAAPSVPWRRPTFAPSLHSAQTTPSLVIDDADPELAEREQDERAAAADQRVVSFLPPILLDRDDRSARQGGLTLAVIILLIAATLTLSYLMRRPDVSGDGVTMADVPATLA